MEIEYQIYNPGSLEEIAATFYCPVPIPHIAVGNSLLPVVGDVSAIAGYNGSFGTSKPTSIRLSTKFTSAACE
jgi:hypothetical protein